VVSQLNPFLFQTSEILSATVLS